MIFLKKITRGYNWRNSLGNKTVQKATSEGEKRIGFCNSAFLTWSAWLGSFNEP